MSNQSDFLSAVQRLSSNQYFIKQYFKLFKMNFLYDLHAMCSHRNIKNNIDIKKLQNDEDIEECFIILNQPVFLYLPNRCFIHPSSSPEKEIISSRIFCFTEREAVSEPVIILDFCREKGNSQSIQIAQTSPEFKVVEESIYYDSDILSTIIMPLIKHLYNATKEWNNHLTFQSMKYLLEDSSSPVSNTPNLT